MKFFCTQNFYGIWDMHTGSFNDHRGKTLLARLLFSCSLFTADSLCTKGLYIIITMMIIIMHFV